MKGVYGGKQRLLDGCCESGLGQQRDNSGGCAKDRKEWSALVQMQMIGFHASIIAWFLCSFRPPSRDLESYHLEREGMPLDEVGVKITGSGWIIISECQVRLVIHLLLRGVVSTGRW